MSFVDTKETEITRAINYLLTQQNSDGSWKTTQEDKIYTTAIVLRSLWLHRKTYSVQTAMDKAKTYLLVQQNADGSYGTETFETALVLRSIAPLEYDKANLQTTIDYLDTLQQASGSWEEDIYTTALALQSLFLADKEVPNPDLASLQGLVVDGDTGIALSDIEVHLVSDENRSLTTSSDGKFFFEGLRNGSYTLYIADNNYAPLQTILNFSGNDIDLGTLRLNKNVNATVSTLTGVIKDKQTGEPIEGAVITVGDKQSTTDSMGAYTISSIEAGSYVVSISKAGYLQNERTVNIPANTILRYNASLRDFDFTVSADILGQVIDKNGSIPLENVKITLSDNHTSKTYMTTADGNFMFDKNKQGVYHLEIQKDGYYIVQTSFSIDSSNTIDFGIVTLQTIDTTTPQLASVQGVIVDAISKSPIEGVLVEVSGLNTLTDATGAYVIGNAPIGEITLSVSKDGYKTASATATLTAGSRLIYSPSLQKNDGILKLYGVILDANSSEPLSDVNISILDTNLSTFTDINGSYIIENIPTGNITIEVSKFGYRTIKITTTVTDKHIVFSPTLQRNGSVNGLTTLSGNIVDTATNEVLENVEIYINGVNTGIVSDGDGNFTIEGIETTDINLTLKKSDYKDVNSMIILSEAQILNIGTLHMRAISIEDFKPDLIAEAINTSGIESDIYTLNVSGELNITISNRGTIPSDPFTMVIFYDTNADGNYTKGLDRVITTKRIEERLDIDNSKVTSVEINTTADFRDQPIYVYVDANNENIELDENNTYSTAKSCGGKQGQIDLGVCFDYSGSVSSYMHIQKSGLIQALRDPQKFPRDGSIRLMVLTGAGQGRVYLSPTIITVHNADEIADKLENSYFSGYDYMGNCLKTMANTWEKMSDGNQSSYRAVTLSGDGIWGPSYWNTTSYINDREYAVAHGVNVVDTIGIGNTYKAGLEAFVYPQPAGGNLGKVYYAKTSEDISNSLITTFKKQTQISDLTLAKLQIIDKGTEQNISIRFTVGNAGVATIPSDINISVYEGDPKNGGIFLAYTSLDENLSFGKSKVIQIDNIALKEGGEIYVVADFENRLVECTKENNSISTIVSATTTLGDIDVKTDKLSYGANEIAILSANISNPGRLSYELTAQLTLSDLEGNIIQVFDAQPLGIVASQESKTVSNEWNTSNTLAGEYLLKGILTDKNGVVVDESSVVFDVVHTGVSAVLDLRLDKAIYSTSDSVQLDNYIRSLSTNSMIKDASIEIEVTNSTQQVIHTQTLRLGTLLPESRRDVAGVYDFVRLSIGEYKVKATLKGDNNISYDTDIQTFKVEENVDSGLKGSVELAWREGYIGAEQTCNYSVSNLGSSVLNNLPLSVKIIDMDNGTLQDEYLKNILLNPLDKEDKSKTIQTQGYQARTYSCGLYAKVHNEWRLLDHKLFTLKYLHAPKAYNDFKNVAHGASAVIDVLHNDSIIKNTLDFSTFRLVNSSGKEVNTLTIAHQGVWHIQSDGQIAFVPQRGYIGDPTPVSYSIKDYTGAILSAKIYLNYPPVAYADSGKTVFGKSVEIKVLGNDKKTSSPFDIKHIRLIDGNNKEQKILSTYKGFWQVDGHKGIIRFTPRKDAQGKDSILYIAYDKGGDKTNKAMVSVQVSQAIKPPPVVVYPPSCSPTPTPILTPTPAAIVSPVVETNSATIHWQDKTYDEIGYMIYQNGVLIAVVDEDVTTLYVEGLENNTEYTFEIVSFDGYGNHTQQFINIKTTLGMGWFTAILHALLG